MSYQSMYSMLGSFKLFHGMGAAVDPAVGGA